MISPALDISAPRGGAAGVATAADPRSADPTDPLGLLDLFGAPFVHDPYP
ncbi:hypothetical protein [Streptomyces sp. Y7]